MSGKENNSSVKKKRRNNYILCLKVNVYVSIMCVVTLEQSFPIFLRWLIAYLKNKVNQPSFCMHLAYNFQPDTSTIILITESYR